MVIVDVSRNDKVETRDAVVIAELVKVVLDEAHGVQPTVIRKDVHVRTKGMAVIHEHCSAALAENDEEVRTGPLPSPEEMGRERHELRFRKIQPFWDAPTPTANVHATAKVHAVH